MFLIISKEFVEAVLGELVEDAEPVNLFKGEIIRLPFDLADLLDEAVTVAGDVNHLGPGRHDALEVVAGRDHLGHGELLLGLPQTVHDLVELLFDLQRLIKVVQLPLTVLHHFYQ